VIGQHELISRPYLEMQRTLHASKPYGERGDKWAPVVMALVKKYRAGSVLDYGCGRGALGRVLREKLSGAVRVSEYDPAIPGKDGMPLFADLVVCTDVLEHIEPDCLDAVLRHLRALARKAVLVVVALVDTANVLPDGRNAHLIIRPANWWRKRAGAVGFTVTRPPLNARKKKSHEWTAVLLP
jgi:2-polyprenyl-3-methyl-5-hydroxy-6-metoxy-1,4-benzoquinol methylase